MHLLAERHIFLSMAALLWCTNVPFKMSPRHPISKQGRRHIVSINILFILRPFPSDTWRQAAMYRRKGSWLQYSQYNIQTPKQSNNKCTCYDRAQNICAHLHARHGASIRFTLLSAQFLLKKLEYENWVSRPWVYWVCTLFFKNKGCSINPKNGLHLTHVHWRQLGAIAWIKLWVPNSKTPFDSYNSTRHAQMISPIEF